jgi:hypothetical protein
MAHSNKFVKGRDRYYTSSILNGDCEETGFEETEVEETEFEETGIDEDDWKECKSIITSLKNVDTTLLSY